MTASRKLNMLLGVNPVINYTCERIDIFDDQIIFIFPDGLQSLAAYPHTLRIVNCLYYLRSMLASTQITFFANA